MKTENIENKMRVRLCACAWKGEEIEWDRKIKEDTQRVFNR